MKEKNNNLIVFDSVVFDKNEKTMTILNGTKGIYSYKEIERCAILNEKSTYKGKGKPFTAIIPKGMGIPAVFEDNYLYVGIKVIMNDGNVLAIYVSEEKTQVGTDQYVSDTKEAEEIKDVITQIIKKYQA